MRKKSKAIITKNKDFIKKSKGFFSPSYTYKNQALIIILFSIIFLIPFRTQAQLFKAFASSGVCISQIDGDEEYGYKRVGYSGGLGVMAPLNPKNPDVGFQMSMELLFSQRGAKATNIADPFAYDCKLNYVDIPLFIHYVDPIGGVTIGLGLQYSRLVKSSEKWTMTDTMIVGMDRPLDTANTKFLKNDFSIIGDIRFTLWRNFKLDFRYQYSLLPIRKDFTFFNSRNSSDDLYYTWNRDFKNNYITLKLIYVINEHHDTYKTKPKRQTAY